MVEMGDDGRDGRGEQTRSMPGVTATMPTMPNADDAAGERAALVSRIGRFRVQRLLGSGGLGDVYLSHHPELDMPVAIKVLRMSMGASSTALRRFEQEARLAARIRHQNVVNVLELGHDEQQDLHFIVMEYVDGQNLEEMLDDRGDALPFEEALGLVTEAARGLAQLSRRHIVHRDIKPSNIIVTRDGTVKLADLGVARALDQDARLTLPDQAVGTPFYMSPEQVEGTAELDSRSDIYSLGVTFYHLVTGAVPFTARSIYELMDEIVTREPMPPRTRNRAIPESGNTVICRMMAKKPGKRYPSTDALLKALEDVAAAMSPESRERLEARSAAARRHKPSFPVLVPPHIPWRAVILGLAAVGIVAGVVWGASLAVGALGGINAVPLGWRVAAWAAAVLALPWVTPFATDWALARKANWAGLVLLAAYTLGGTVLAAALLGFVFVPAWRVGVLAAAAVMALVYSYVACEMIGGSR